MRYALELAGMAVALTISLFFTVGWGAILPVIGLLWLVGWLA